MQRDSRAEIRRAVFAETEGEGFREQFARIRGGSSALRRFASAAELLAFLRDADPSKYDENDAILYALLRSAQSEGRAGNGAKVLLVTAMWPAVEHAYFRLLPRLRDAADPFSEVYWAFLEEVGSWNPETRSYVAVQLARRTERRVRRTVRLEEQYQAFCREMREAAHAAGPDGLRAARVGRRKFSLSKRDKLEAKSVLDGLVDRGAITLGESLLIAGHALYDRKLKDLAAESGDGYRTVSKRYQRAVRKVWKALRGTCTFPGKSLSPR